MAVTPMVWSIQRLSKILESCGNDTAGCGNLYILIWNFPMQGSCDKIYVNAHEIIGWDPGKGKNNIERVTAMAVDVSDVGTG